MTPYERLINAGGAAVHVFPKSSVWWQVSSASFGWFDEFGMETTKGHLVMERLEEVRGQSATVYATECGFLATVCLDLLSFFFPSQF